MVNLFWSFILFFLSTGTPENPIDGTVTAVFDGNTLEVSTREDEFYRVVLPGIDCPELKQEYGIQAKGLLEKWLLDRKVLLFVQGKDRYRNYIGVVLLEDNRDARLALLEEGLAWTSEKSPDARFESIRLKALRERKGLWKQDNPVAPWIYRRQESMREAKSR